MNDTTKQVRTILMNELGLTRDSIRQEMERIVVQTIDAHATRINWDETVKRVIAKEVLGAQWGSLDSIRQNVDREINKQVRDHVANIISERTGVTVAVKEQAATERRALHVSELSDETIERLTRSEMPKEYAHLDLLDMEITPDMIERGAQAAIKTAGWRGDYGVHNLVQAILPAMDER